MQIIISVKLGWKTITIKLEEKYVRKFSSITLMILIVASTVYDILGLTGIVPREILFIVSFGLGILISRNFYRNIYGLWAKRKISS